MNRREFLKGCGLTVAIGLTPLGAIALRAADRRRDFEPNLWLTITPEDRVICWVNKSEMGQGIYTSFPMILADELGASLSQVEVRPAPALPGYGDPESGGILLTGGSTSIRHMYGFLRTAGAGAREMMIAAAAKLWKEPAAEIRCRDGRIEGKGHAASFGEIVRYARKERPPARPALKDPKEFVYIGTPVERLDIPEKVAGKAKFGIDVSLPGLVYAFFVRPPRFGAKPKAVDERAAKAIPGVIAVQSLSQGVAVFAETIDAAFGGREALRVDWQGGDDKLSSASAETALVEVLQTEGIVAREDGRPREIWNSGARKLERSYKLPFLAHGTLEPMNATAWVRNGRCDVWTGTQFQTGSVKAAAQICGLPESSVEVHTQYLGGGFGRRSALDFVIDAVEASKAANRPVKVIYSREEDFAAGRYRPANATRVQAVLDDRGMPAAWIHRIAVPSIFASAFPARMKNGIDPAAVEGLVNLPYAVPNLRVEWIRKDFSVPVWFWRSVGSTHNAFTVETFVDELARLAGKDPVNYRLSLLSDPDAKRVVEAAAEKACWGRTKTGRQMGFAYHRCFGSHVAQCIEISVDPKGLVLHRVVCAVDCGPVVNPNTVKAQMESGILMGLSAALKERVLIEEGRIVSNNFDKYPILRMGEIPKDIDVFLIQGQKELGGVGEPGTPPAAPALANALFAATGRRAESLPLAL
ncbi:xanthine dehydrogenase family protein molybdopterin-binding subunit [Verrucomicrobium sp. 3C]|uniref:xanthine dehydrogenase family protein molybdopterin-binding subunit n=1 Tax=Verrucomicrobium sp. 3C TaxID=1134055 RepID=UPI0003737FCA|nr:molybdopterin cofactor-binding domain-containing protein [Verrucomicrobium sp. 3C]